MKLFFREMGEGQPLIILHGLFGSSDNWLTIGKALSEKYKVYLLDQRNHGQSPHSNEFNYSSMALDLEEFIQQQQIANPIIIGHSMGGKTVMQYAVNNPNSWMKMVVVDIAPKAYPVHHDSILEGLNSLDLTGLSSRGEADKYLAEYIPEVGVRQFLLKNLNRDSGGFNWKINLPVITSNIEIIGEGLNGNLKDSKPVLFIRGRNSNYIKDSDFTLIEESFPNAQIETVENAGHWVHAEQSDNFMAVLITFLNR
ncbi:alpha/beta fold hydrolase [Fulvivirga lutimaris]|uniref:alpha/beta fold hydrolase n=1 Tax=Fulvivirga lutimaris TaxID=1819566 RepID=UPI0012BB5347|nr:alpha/beta fold hydrolase [Fulvivirga lutimaris]MTI41933.1 alpha/beta fold hydrolase [Fulvivirga lutimaris]